MTAVMTVFTRIPVVYGYFNLGDVVVLLAGVLFGGFTGAFAGAVGSAFADIIGGAYIFAPITFVVKGLEGYAAGRISGGGIAGNSGIGRISRRISGAGSEGGNITPALAIGAGIMVAGFFIAEATVLSLFDRAFGFGAAIAELPFNLAQGVISAALTRIAVEGLKKTRII